MDETYIIIEEDNERKILPEGEEIKKAHRETEKRYRHLVEPVVPGTDLEAIRSRFLRTPLPEEPPEQPAEETPSVQPPAGEAGENEASPEVAESPQPASAPLPEEPKRSIEDEVRDLIQKYKSERPTAVQEEISPPLPSKQAGDDPKEPIDDHGVRYTVLNESDVEILSVEDLPSESGLGPVCVTPLENRETGIRGSKDPGTGSGGSPSDRAPLASSLLAAAGVAVLTLLCICLIWSV